MTFDISPRQLAEHDDGFQHTGPPRAVWLVHGFVCFAMVLVALALVALLAEQAEWPRQAAAVAGGLAFLAGGLVHLAVVLVAARRTPIAVKQRPARPAATASTAALEATGLIPVNQSVVPAEPTDLARALLAQAVVALAPSAGPAGAGPAGAGPAGAGPAGDVPSQPADQSTVLSEAATSYGPGTGLSWAYDLAAHMPREASPDVGVALAPAQAVAAESPRNDGSMLVPVPSAVSGVAPAAARAASETELERVNRLVRRLADHVNQLEAAAHPHVGASAHVNAAYSAFVGERAAEPLDPEQLSLFPDGGLASHQLAASISALRRLSDDPATEPAFVPAPMAATSVDQPSGAIFDQKAGATAIASQAQAADIISALNSQRIDVFLEPILDLEGQRAQHYEVSIAVRSLTGQRIELATVAADLSGTGVLPLIDQGRLARAAGMARRLADRGKTGSVFAELNGETLDDEDFQDAVAAQESAGAFPGQLVLALPQSHVRLFTPADWLTLARLKVAGFGFALTDVTGLDMDFEALVQAGFAFARLDAATFLTGLPLADGVVSPPDICRHLSACGLALIVGGITGDNQLARIFGFGVLFGQGQLFGGPRQAKAAAMTGQADASAMGVAAAAG